ncbi:MAG: hypothetical protein ACP5T3_02900 [Candidatus Micrarchaeia archaeon]
MSEMISAQQAKELAKKQTHIIDLNRFKEVWRKLPDNYVLVEESVEYGRTLLSVKLVCQGTENTLKIEYPHGLVASTEPFEYAAKVKEGNVEKCGTVYERHFVFGVLTGIEYVGLIDQNRVHAIVDKAPYPTEWEEIYYVGMPEKRVPIGEDAIVLSIKESVNVSEAILNMRITAIAKNSERLLADTAVPVRRL